MRHQLREDAVEGIRMEKRDLEAEEAAARLLVDELDALVSELVERAAHVVDLVRHVVHPRAALGEELADGSVLTERGEQLDPPFADAERRGLDPLLRHVLAMLEPRTEDALVGRDRL